MSKRKYVNPQSTVVQLHVANMLASSIKVDPSVDVDDSDKSVQREWDSDCAWEEE